MVNKNGKEIIIDQDMIINKDLTVRLLGSNKIFLRLTKVDIEKGTAKTVNFKIKTNETNSAEIVMEELTRVFQYIEGHYEFISEDKNMTTFNSYEEAQQDIDYTIQQYIDKGYMNDA